METDRKKITEENLIRCGREEFLEKGYAGANLRDICKRAGVTTGAFYFSFENKEALLGAILDPLIAEYQKMMYEITKREQEHPETAEQNEREIMEYICAHRQEYELLLEKCSGSKYEAFRDEVFSNMQTVFQDYYDMDYRLFLTKAIGIHADVGTQILIGLYPPKFPPESNGLLQIRFVFKQFQLFRHFDCKIHIAVCSRSSDPVGSHHIFFTGERRFDPL